jgi:GT2 family glycosyltransferase
MAADGISVIVPAYESWPILQRTLAAILHDLRKITGPWELVVVDNESASPLHERVRQLADGEQRVQVVRRTQLGGRHFQPGAARNVGIERAAHDCLVFLDADCIPTSGMLGRYRDLVAEHRDCVFIGHRTFVDPRGLNADVIARERRVLDGLPRVDSKSNYGEAEDRRLPEMAELAAHPRPYDFLYGCNFALHRSCLGELRFDPAYDGYWGYEDIDLGLRLHRARREFRYVPESFVFHQESIQISVAERRQGRMRNLALLESRCPGFIEYRSSSGRPGSLPRDLVTWPTEALAHALGA